MDSGVAQGRFVHITFRENEIIWEDKVDAKILNPVQLTPSLQTELKGNCTTNITRPIPNKNT